MAQPGAERWLVTALSERALISILKARGSFTQDGTSPQRTSAISRPPRGVSRTIATGCEGAML